MALEHPAPFGNRWRSRWIWFEPPAIVMPTLTRPERAVDGDQVGLFRRSFTLEAVPATGPCRIWSDGRHVLRVNGVEVARGPVRSEPRRSHYDAVDLAPHLRVGENVLAVTAVHFAHQTSWWMPVPPSYSLGAGSLTLEACLGDPADDAAWIVSDATWRSCRGEAWTPVQPPGDVSSLPLEWFDARAHPDGWDEPGYDDSDWAAPHEIHPVHTGTSGRVHPPSEPFGVLRPPVRADAGAPAPVAHEAAATERRPLPAAAAGLDALDGDPVAQVLADERLLAETAPLDDGDAADGTPVTAVPGDPGGAATTRNAGGSIVVTTGEVRSYDLGHVAAGTVVLDVDGADAGTVIDLAGADLLDHHGGLADLGEHAGFRYVCRGDGPERFESSWAIGARHLHLAVRAPTGHHGNGGDLPGDVATRSEAGAGVVLGPDLPGAPAPRIRVSVHERLRPRPEGVAFACSDPDLERIFAIGLRTVDLCALDAYVDCPTREQRAWTGDAVVHQMVDLATNPDWSVARWHPQLTAVSRADGMVPMAVASDFAFEDRTMIPDWSLHWVRSVHNLWRYTGDHDLIAELLPVAERTVRWFEPYRNADGLLDGVTGWTLVDWASVYSSGCSSALNALWARALEDLADLAGGLGNEGTATWARSRHAEVRDAFDAFWDDERDRYVDHLVDGERQVVAAQHGGAAALAAGLVPDDRLGRVIDRLTDRTRLLRHSWVMDTATVEKANSGQAFLAFGYPEPDWDVDEQVVSCEPFFRYVLHDGLARAGRADLVVDQCRDWQVFVDAGETSWPENWNGGTRCHGWSSTPTRDLIVHVLGITPAEPGFASVRVAPALGGLEWAKATVPSPHGFITVEAHADGTVEVDSPIPVVRP